MCGIIVEAVITPVACVRKRTGNKSTQFVLVVFGLCKHTFLQSITVIVTINYITHLQFLVDKSITGCCCSIVGHQHILTGRRVYEIVATIEVAKFIGVYTFVITEVDTAIEIYIFTELGRISGKQTHPSVLVVRLGHGHSGTILTFLIQLINFVVSKCTVFVAESGVQSAIRRAIPLASVC